MKKAADERRGRRPKEKTRRDAEDPGRNPPRAQWSGEYTGARGASPAGRSALAQPPHLGFDLRGVLDHFEHAIGGLAIENKSDFLE